LKPLINVNPVGGFAAGHRRPKCAKYLSFIKTNFSSKQIGFRLNMSKVTIWVELEDGALILKYEGTFR